MASAPTPAALVERATHPCQRTVAGTLQSLSTLALVHGVKAPALIMIGGVVALHEQLGDGSVSDSAAKSSWRGMPAAIGSTSATRAPG